MVRLRYVSVWLTLVMATVLVNPTPAVAGTLPEGTVP